MFTIIAIVRNTVFLFSKYFLRASPVAYLFEYYNAMNLLTVTPVCTKSMDEALNEAGCEIKIIFESCATNF